MSDLYKNEMNLLCGVGGIHCHCCNPFKGSRKKWLNRLARRRLKEKMKKEIDTKDNE